VRQQCETGSSCDLASTYSLFVSRSHLFGAVVATSRRVFLLLGGPVRRRRAWTNLPSMLGNLQTDFFRRTCLDGGIDLFPCRQTIPADEPRLNSPTLIRRDFFAATPTPASTTSPPARQRSAQDKRPSMNLAELDDMKAEATISTGSCAGARLRQSSRHEGCRLLRPHHAACDPGRHLGPVGPAAHRRRRGPDGDPRAGPVHSASPSER
jgi:hypothetical protein